MISRNVLRVALALAAAAMAVPALSAAALAAPPLSAAPAAAPGTGHRWIIEWSRRERLDAAHRAMVTAPSSVLMAQSTWQMAQTDGQQYTAVGRCTTMSLALGGTPCFSLSAHPPAPGTHALVDLEHWRLTPPA
jgi:hypothetical protein